MIKPTKPPVEGLFVGAVSTTRSGASWRLGNSKRAARLVKNAVKRVAEMDDVDGCSQTAFPIDIALRTVLSAIQCGMEMQRWDTVADAFVMLIQIEQFVRETAKPVG